MRNCLVAAITVLVAVMSVSAQEQKQDFLDEFYLDVHLKEAVAPIHNVHMVVDEFPSKDIDSVIDVLSYEIWTDWSMALTTARSERPDRKAESRVKAVVKVIDGIKPLIMELYWNAMTVDIDSVFVNGDSVGFGKTSTVLVIELNEGITGGDTIELDIFYAMESDARGFYCYSHFETDTLDGVLHPIAFTFSEPQDARRWFPCNDVPHDKALFTVHTRVPEGFVVVSNGTRKDSVADTDSTSWQTWSSPDPMPTYLVTINASPFHLYTQYFVRESGDSIPILNYHWLEDQDGDEFNALNALRNIPAMFTVFEDRLGTYPFDTYGHVSIAPVRIGGMEHQTMSSINRRWLMGRAEAGYAHELAHQWLGDEVTCATWGDIWLNEGGASFSEALWREENEGPAAYKSHLANKRDRYMRNGLNEPPVYDIPLFMLFNEATTYNKSAWVYHMSRRMVGDDAFFPGLRSYIQKFHMRSAQTKDMLEHYKEVMPDPIVDWDTFFDQWLVKAGHPVFVAQNRANNEPHGGKYANYITIRQVQSGFDVPEAFIAPLTIRLMNLGSIVDTTIMITERVTTVTLYSPFEVDTIALDPNDDLLCQKTTQTVTSVEEEGSVKSMAVGPVPVHRGQTLHMVVPQGARLRVIDVAGRTLMLHTEASQMALLDTSSWPLGLVSIVIESRGKIEVVSVPVIE